MRNLAVLPILALAFTVAAAAQSRRPDPALSKLDFLAGSWTIQGTENFSPKATEQKAPQRMEIKTHDDWLQGHHFLIERSHGMFGGFGEAAELQVIGYDTDRKVYTITSFENNGEIERGTGTVEGTTWTWSMETPSSEPRFRFIWNVLSPTSYTLKFETSKDGTNWVAVLNAKATKQPK